MDERFYNVWMIARPAPDLPGQWVAHCLDFDVVSQGDTLLHALQMVEEAAAMVALDDLNRGRDPGARRAPEEYFGELRALFERGQKLAPNEIQKAADERRLVCIAVPVLFHFARRANELTMPSVHPMPLAIVQASC